MDRSEQRKDMKGLSKYGPLRQGDWNKNKSKQFWAYLKGKEMWVTPERFKDAMDNMRWWV